MNIIERGSGPPLIVIPGLQGRWEYVAPAVESLSSAFRVITFSLCDEPSARAPFDPAGGLDTYAAQVGAVLDDRGLTRAAICGISFGGRVALRFAAVNPGRTAALILVSTPGPGFGLRRRHEIYARIPWVFGPLFLLETPFRLNPELRAAMPHARDRRRFSRLALRTLLRAPVSTSRMAARSRLLTAVDVARDCERVAAPALVVTGEPGLDFVVPADGSLEYARLIPGARAVVLEHTGHLGSITRPDRFAEVVREFVDAQRKRWPDAAA